MVSSGEWWRIPVELRAMDLALLPQQSLLEAGALPYADLVRFATREGRRPRPIYQIHKWFARRLGCSFRAVLVGAVSDPTARLACRGPRRAAAPSSPPDPAGGTHRGGHEGREAGAVKA